MLDARHGAATALSRHLEARGFIRSDRDTLLFRDATAALRDRLEAVKPGVATCGDKGFEVRWSAVDETDIGHMFDAIRTLAATIPAT
jgi:HEAT repeat protein